MGERKTTPENENIKKWNTWYSEDKKQYQQFARSRRERNRFKQEALTEIYQRGREYIMEHRVSGDPITTSGLQLACGCNRMDFSRMRSGEYDWRRYQFMEYNGIDESDILVEFDEVLSLDIEYAPDKDGELMVVNLYSEILNRFYLEIQNQLETACYTSYNPRGAIFLLKSIFGWADNQQDAGKGLAQVIVTPAEIHIATRDEAEQAMKDLLTK